MNRHIIKDPPCTLCETCCEGTVVQLRGQDRIYHCSELGERLYHEVTKCTSYRSILVMSMWTMQEIAYVLENKKGTMGFTTPSEYRKEHGDTPNVHRDKQIIRRAGF